MGSLGENSALSKILAETSDPICGIGDDGQINFWNQAAERTFGYPKPEAVGSQLTDLFSLDECETETLEEIIELFEPTTWQVFDSEEFEITATMAEGSRTKVSLRPIERHYDVILCFVEPIEERHFEVSEIDCEDLKIYRQMVDGSTDMLAAADANERFLYANESYRNFHGIEEPVEGKPLEAVLSLENYSEIRSRIARVLDGENINFRMKRQGPEGDLRKLNVKYYPLRDEEGTVIGGITSLRDITELEQRGTALRESWETYQEVVDSIPDPIVLFDQDGNILESNNAACRGFEYTEEELSELNFDDLVYDEWVDWIESHLDGHRSDPVVFEAEYLARSGQSFPVEVVSTRIDYFGSEAILTVARDLSDRKEFERQLQEANARLEEFAAVITQDLRNPLTVARGWSEMAESKTASEPIGKIRDALDRMENIIEYTYTLARKGSNIGKLKTVNLQTVIRQSWHAVETEGATLEEEIECSLRGDIDRLSQLFETLFENSISQATEPVRVRVGGLENGRGFFVANDGPKIPKEDRKHSVGSSHIGTPNESAYDIAAIKRIANAHGWHLRLTESELGGARIEFHGVESCDANAD